MFFGALHFKTPDFTAEYLRTDIGISEYYKTELSYDWMNRHSNIKHKFIYNVLYILYLNIIIQIYIIVSGMILP